jgi:hypothetical protein
MKKNTELKDFVAGNFDLHQVETLLQNLFWKVTYKSTASKSQYILVFKAQVPETVVFSSISQDRKEALVDVIKKANTLTFSIKEFEAWNRILTEIKGQTQAE